VVVVDTSKNVAPLALVAWLSSNQTKGHRKMGRWLAGILATVIGGILIFWLTEGLRSSPQPPPSSLAPSDTASDISGSYLMDQLSHRVVVITHLSGPRYRIEEPSGSWPWEGTAILDGGSIYGEARFRNDLATMRVEGHIRSDGSIVVRYVFMTGSDGKPAGDKIHPHVWYPANR
jgi:hypothetical protein